MKAYGESILLKSNDYGLAPSTYIITGIVTAVVEFNHYDGIQLSSLFKRINIQ